MTHISCETIPVTSVSNRLLRDLGHDYICSTRLRKTECKYFTPGAKHWHAERPSGRSGTPRLFRRFHATRTFSGTKSFFPELGTFVVFTPQIVVP